MPIFFWNCPIGWGLILEQELHLSFSGISIHSLGAIVPGGFGLRPGATFACGRGWVKWRRRGCCDGTNPKP